MARPSSNAYAIAGGVAAALAIGAAAVWFGPPVQDAEVASGAGPQVAAVTTQDAAAVDAPKVTVTQGLPTIDTFYRSPDDTTVIAGIAAPGQSVAIMLGGDVVETVVAGADGAFGAVVAIAASDQPRRVQLIADPDGAALASAESIIVPPKEIAVADDPVAVPAAVDDLTAPAAPPTLIADADGVRILQVETQSPAQPDLTENIGLDTITYDPSGEVQLAGRGAAAGGFVRIYLDNEPITESRISGEGDWRSDLPQVDTGLYTLRVDEVDADGVVQSRVETPFKKEEPEEVAAILAEETAAEGFDIAVKTVQPGATLWAIAEEQLGSGVLYVSVFEANRDLIRDPDLIYPGQVFRIPEAAQ